MHMINGVNNFYYLPRIFLLFLDKRKVPKENIVPFASSLHSLTNMSIHLESSNNPILMYKLKNPNFYI